MYLKKLWELFRGVDWRPLEREVRCLYNTEGRGRRPKPPLGYLRAVLVKMLWGITSYRALVERLENNPDLNRMCGFKDRRSPSRTGVSRFLRRLSEAELDRSISYYASHWPASNPTSGRAPTRLSLRTETAQATQNKHHTCLKPSLFHASPGAKPQTKNHPAPHPFFTRQLLNTNV